jgi:hypothetical protein
MVDFATNIDKGVLNEYILYQSYVFASFIL